VFGSSPEDGAMAIHAEIEPLKDLRASA